jgi:hypothetical protein
MSGLKVRKGCFKLINPCLFVAVRSENEFGLCAASKNNSDLEMMNKCVRRPPPHFLISSRAARHPVNYPKVSLCAYRITLPLGGKIPQYICAFRKASILLKKCAKVQFISSRFCSPKEMKRRLRPRRDRKLKILPHPPPHTHYKMLLE